MRVSDLELPSDVVDYYRSRGIVELYPPQAQAFDMGVLEGRNLLAAIPTASGKTLIAELAMLTSIRAGGKALYIVPLRALASEKYEQFKELEDLGVNVAISTGDFDTRDELLGRADIIIVTSEKADSLLRNGVSWMNDVTVVVADEVHLLDSARRGPTLEVTLAKLRRLTDAQVIALSATVGNADEVAGWLDAEMVVSEWRPVELREGILYGRALHFDGEKREIRAEHRHESVALVMDALRDGGQSLVFESSRKNSEASARRVSKAIPKLIDPQEIEALQNLAGEVEDSGETDTCRRLAECVRGGAAFHHAGLKSEQRRMIEDGFRRGLIKCICSTPTLASGINLPARRVIIRGIKRYDPNYGMVPIPVLEYKQMAGRAGRPGLDPFGEALLIAKGHDQLEWLRETYVTAEPERIWSKLAVESALRSHILSTVATGFAHDRDTLMEFMEATFYAAQSDLREMEHVVDRVLAYLENEEMLVEDGVIRATPRGELVSKLYLDPMSAAGLLDIRGHDGEVTDLTLLYLAARTPDVRTMYMRGRDYEWVHQFVYNHEEEFVSPPGEFSQDYESFLADVKTARLLHEWVSETPEDEITEKFGVGPGDLRGLAEAGEWIMHAAAELYRQENLPYHVKAQELVTRLKYGAGPELLELVQIRGIGRVRARNLYRAGFTSLQKLRDAPSEKVASVLGELTAAKVLRQLGVDYEPRDKSGTTTGSEGTQAEEPGGQSFLHDFQ